MVPTIRNCQGSNLNDDALCLEVNFNDGGPNEKAFLNRIDNCVHSGSFENVDVAIAATSEECPRIETSNMQVSILIFLLLRNTQNVSTSKRQNIEMSQFSKASKT